MSSENDQPGERQRKVNPPNKFLDGLGRFFTRYFFASLLVAIIGIAFSFLPLIISAVRLDVTNPTDPQQTVHMTTIAFGSYRFESLQILLKDAIFASIALGIAAAITWIETLISSRQKSDFSLGRVANAFAGMSVFGLICSIFLLIALVPLQDRADLVPSEFEKWVKATYYIVIGTSLSYLFTLVQIRRVIDLEAT